VVIEKALHGELSPVGPIYRLDDRGLPLAYDVILNIDWSRVRVNPEERGQHQGAISLSVDVDEVVDTLGEARPPSIDSQELVCRVAIITKCGELISLTPSAALEQRAAFREDMAAHRVIHIRPDAVDFGSKQIRSIRVNLRYEDAEHGLRIADGCTFTSCGDSATFEYDLVGSGRESYEFETITELTNRLTHRRRWASSEDQTLVIPVG
jgi:hypothetical protein